MVGQGNIEHGRDTGRDQRLPWACGARRWAWRALALLAASIAITLGWQAAPATAVSDAVVRIVPSATGTSTANDAIPVETLTFSEANAALGTRPDTGATITVPTTIAGLTATLRDASVLTQTSTASLTVTGTTTNIFGQTFSPAIDVLVLVDWDENDSADDDPRVIVAAQPTSTTLGELAGVGGSSMVTGIAVDVGTLTATNRLDPTIVTGTDTALVPADAPSAVRTFFGRLGGFDPSAPLRLTGPINLHASIDVADINPVVAEATGRAPGTATVLAGVIGVDVADFPASGTAAIQGLSLRAPVDDLVLPDDLRGILGVPPTATPGSLDVVVLDGGTPTVPADDELGLLVTTSVTPRAPLPTRPVALSVGVFPDGPDRVVGFVSGDIGGWSAPFGVATIPLRDVALSGTIEAPLVGGPAVTDVVLDATATVDGAASAAVIDGDLRAPSDATLTVGLDRTLPLGDLLDAIGLDDGGIIPTHVVDATAGPGTITVASRAGDVSVTFDGRFDLRLQPGSPGTVAATVFVESRNGLDDVTIAIRPDTDLALSDLVPGAAPDFDLNAGGSSFALVFSTIGIDTTRGELAPPALRFFGPLFLTGDDTEVQILPGASSLGLVRLPDNVAGFLRSSLGIEPTARFSGTVPAGAGSNFNFQLALDVDPTFAPEWVASAGLSLDVNAGTAGVGINLTGSLTARFRAGVDPVVADELADLGIDVASDEPVPSDHECRGTAETLEIPATGGGTEYRCFDSLTFTVGTSLTVNPTNVTADLTFTLDAAVMGDDYGWQPFGLSWVEINRLRLEVGVQWDALAPPPGVALTMGMSGDVTIGGKDLFAAIRLTATPIPAPPFVKIELDGFRLSSDAGFEIDDFFALQHDLAVSAAELASVDPSTVPPAFRVEDIGIPNVALRNLDLSFSLTGAATLCIPQGLHISADLYVNPTGDPTVRGPKCDDTGAPIPPPVGSTCSENQDKGCLAGGRIALTVTGFNADLDLAGFDLGPLQFQQSKLDLQIESLESHLIMFGGVSLDPIGQGQMQMSIERSGLATTASFAGLVEIGPAGSPFITALAEGTAAFDPAEIQTAGIDFRFVLNAEGLDIDALTATLEANAKTAIQQSAQAIVDFLNGLDAELTAFTNDPATYVRTQLAAVGVTIPSELQPLIDGIAELAAEGVTATEDMVLRGQLGGAPVGGADKVPQCAGIQFLGSDDRCYDVLPLPTIDGVAKETVCVAPNLIEVGGRCYSLPPVDGLPTGGVAPTLTCPISSPQLQGGRCYSFTPNPDLDPDGTPDGGVAPSVGCPVLSPFLVGGRCYTTPPSSGTPSGGAAKQTVCVFPNIQERGGRCYSILATPAGGDAPIGQVCAVPTPFEGADGRCYVVPPIDTVGLCDAFGALPDVNLPSNCTRRQFFDEVIVPAIYAASAFTQQVVEETIDILDALPTFEIECMEFRLTLDRSTTAVTMSITAGIDGDVSTFSLGWDLAQDVGTNLTGLLDGLRGGAATPCAPIDLLDFADEVIGTDGGELLTPAIPVADVLVLPEGSSRRLFPFDNDTNASTSTITGLNLTVFTVPIPVPLTAAPLAAPAAFAPGLPSASAGGVDAWTQPDLRSILFTANDDLAPGTSRVLNLEITSVNSSGVATRSTGTVVFTGSDNAPITALDLATLDLRSATDVLVDVLANDTDTEDGRPAGVAVADGGGSAGCAAVDSGQVRVAATGCDGSSPFAGLPDGASLVDTVGYSAVDSAGNATAGAIAVTVIGRNDEPSADGFRIAPRVEEPGSTFTLTANVNDPDDGDALDVVIDWGDGSSGTLAGVIPGAGVRDDHAYATAGTYTVRLTVTDWSGAASSSSTLVIVRSASSLAIVDADGDGFDSTVDCRDFDPTVFPGATEILDNGIDDNCNGDLDDASSPAGGGGDGGGDGGDGGGGGGNPTPGGPTDPTPNDPPINPNLPQTGAEMFRTMHLGVAMLLAGMALSVVAWRRRTAVV